MYGWPPTGPGPSLKRAARSYVQEMGPEHPLVADFLVAARRHVKLKEKMCEEELTPKEKEILHFRGLYDADPPAPKLLRDDYREKMNEKCGEVMEALKVWRATLGEDNDVYLRFLKSTLAPEPFLDNCEDRAAALGVELRALGLRPPPSFEENHVTEARAIDLTALAFCLETLERGGRNEQLGFHPAPVQPSWRGEQAALEACPLREEFASELRRVAEAVQLFKAEEPPPKLERVLPAMRDGENINMRLHGVDYGDIHRHGEVMLLELCADIIAEETGIPRHCLYNLAFTDPKTGMEEVHEEAELPALDEDGNPIVPALDEDGNPIVPAKEVELPALDEDGNPIVPAPDENGSPIELSKELVMDEDGNPIVDDGTEAGSRPGTSQSPPGTSQSQPKSDLSKISEAESTG